MLGKSRLGLGLLGVAWLALGACSKNDGGGGSSGFCATLEQRQRDCNLIEEGATSCVNYEDGAEGCETSCIAAAGCSDVAQWTCGGPLPYASELDQCMGRCVGLEPVRCQDGRTLGGYARCNGVADCSNSFEGNGDDTDERGCASTGYQCRNVAAKVPFEALCDGKRACSDGSDELPDCAVVDTCSSSIDGATMDVQLRMICNGYEDCADGRDENAHCAARFCGD